MGNNTPDYNDNLAFEPKMTMEQVFKIAVDEYGWSNLGGNLFNGLITISNCGSILKDCWNCDKEDTISENRTPEEVLMIIKGLGK